MNTVMNFTVACNAWNIWCERAAVVVWKTAGCYCTDCFGYFGKEKFFLIGRSVSAFCV